MKIRKAKLGDLEDLTNIMVKFKEGQSDFEPNYLKTFRKKHKSFSQIRKSVSLEIENNKGLILVIEDDGIIIGFIYGTLCENNHMVFKTVRYGYLNHIWIKEGYRKRGLASILKKKAFTWFKKNKCKYIKLSVLDINPSKKVYKKWGFDVVSESMYKLI